MLHSTDASNRRILIIDDNQAIHEDFRKILDARSAEYALLEEAEAVLLGTALQGAGQPRFEIDSAFQGEEGLALIRRASVQVLVHRPARATDCGL